MKDKFKKFFNSIGSSIGLWGYDNHCDHDDHDNSNDGGHDHSVNFIPKVWILVLALIFTLFSLISAFVNNVFFDNETYQLVTATIIIILIDLAFFKSTIISISKKKISEDILVFLSGTIAYVYSLVIFITHHNNLEDYHLFFNECIEILSLIYLGRFIEEWLTNKVTKDMNSLESLKVKDAILLKNGKEIITPVNELKIGDVILIKPGSIIPIDGVVIKGITTIDESSLTGESLPITKKNGSSVFGGTVASDGVIEIRVSKLFSDSFINKIIEGVYEASSTKPETQKIADKIAKILVPSVMLIATLTFILTYLLGGTSPESMASAVLASVTVFVISCPCSFAMTTPLSILVASSTSKKEGILFNSKNIFETIKKIDTISFDKTGTLTKGEFIVQENTVPKNILPILISAEKTSNHPLAISIVNNYNDSKIKLPSVKTKEILGKGMIAKSSDKEIYIGSLSFVNDYFKHKEDEKIILKRKNGSAIIYVFNKKSIYGYVELRDEIKESALESLSLLRKMKINVVMITGDQRDTALNIASQLGINDENVYSEVSPSDKSNIIKKLQENGKIVAFVGDGINDTVALTQSDLGIAMGKGTDAAIDVADIILNKEDLSLVPYSIFLSRKTLFTINRGFTIAIIYNMIAIPIAALGIIPPIVGAISMVFNDTIAMLNASTLLTKRKKKFYKKLKHKKI